MNSVLENISSDQLRYNRRDAELEIPLLSEYIGMDWHILLLDRELDQSRLNILRASVTTRFARGVARSGGHATVLGQNLRPMAPGSEGPLAFYCFKGTTIYRDVDGSRAPMAILDDLESTGEGLALWDELTAAVSADRRMQVITSRRIDSLCTHGAHTTLDK